MNEQDTKVNVLDSWKEIAVFLRRGVRTVQRWERTEGLPVRRHEHMKRGSVFALASDLSTWQRLRQFKVNDHERALYSREAYAAKIDEVKQRLEMLQLLTATQARLIEHGKKLSQMHGHIESLVAKLD